MADDFYLDIGHMDEVINQVQDLAKKTEDLREKFSKSLEKATVDWSGKSRTEFDKKAHTVMQQVTDVTESIYEVAEALIDASKSYMQADTDLAKSLEGTTERY